MKHAIISLFLPFLIVGCAATGDPVQDNYRNFVTALEVRQVTIKTIVDLNDAGLIDPSSYDEIDELIRVSAEALNVWLELLKNSQPTDQAEDQFWNSLRKLQSIRDRAPPNA